MLWRHFKKWKRKSKVKWLYCNIILNLNLKLIYMKIKRLKILFKNWWFKQNLVMSIIWKYIGENIDNIEKIYISCVFVSTGMGTFSKSNDSLNFTLNTIYLSCHINKFLNFCACNQILHYGVLLKWQASFYISSSLLLWSRVLISLPLSLAHIIIKQDIALL